MKPFYLDFIWQQTLRAEEHNQFHQNPEQAQILLIHANLLNAYVLPDIINLYKQNGYEFVHLEEALKTFKSPIQCSRAHMLAQNKNNISNEREPRTEMLILRHLLNGIKPRKTIEAVTSELKRNGLSTTFLG